MSAHTHRKTSIYIYIYIYIYTHTHTHVIFLFISCVTTVIAYVLTFNLHCSCRGRYFAYNNYSLLQKKYPQVFSRPRGLATFCAVDFPDVETRAEFITKTRNNGKTRIIIKLYCNILRFSFRKVRRSSSGVNIDHMYAL